MLLGAIGLGVRTQQTFLDDVERYEFPLDTISDAATLTDALAAERNASLAVRERRNGAPPAREIDQVSPMAISVSDERLATDDAVKQFKRSLALGAQDIDPDVFGTRIATARRHAESLASSMSETQHEYDSVIREVIVQIEVHSPAPPQPVAPGVTRYLAMINARRVAGAEDRGILNLALRDTDPARSGVGRALFTQPADRQDLFAHNAVELTYLGQYVNSGDRERNSGYFEALASAAWSDVNANRAAIFSTARHQVTESTVTVRDWSLSSADRLAMLTELRDVEYSRSKAALATAIDDARSQLRLYLALGVAGSFLLFIGLLIYARSLTLPMLALRSAANDLSGGRIHPIDDTGSDELSIVAHAFRRLHDQMSGLWSDADQVRQSLESGAQGARLDVSRYDGDWNSLVTGFNDTLQASEDSAIRLKAEVQRRACLAEIAEVAVAASDSASVAASAVNRLSQLPGVSGCFLSPDPEVGYLTPKFQRINLSTGRSFDGNLAMFSSITGGDGLLARIVLVWDGELVDREISATERTLEAAARMIAQTHRREVAENQVLFQANHDLTTGLPNARVFESWVHTRMQAHAARPVAVLAMHLRNLGRARSTGGQQMVDLIVKQSAERLRDSAGFDAMIARAESDHLLVGLTSTPDAQLQAERLARILREPILDATGTVEARISAGFAVAWSIDDAFQVTQHALAAASEADSLDSVDAIEFSPDLLARLDRRRNLELWFDEAISQDRSADEDPLLTVWYQPIIDARTGDVVGYEALARGFDAAGSPILPADFVPVIEESERIHELGRYVSRLAINDLDSLAGADTYVAVNVSPHEIHRGDLPLLFDELGWDQRSRSQLAVEITEGLALIDDHVVMDVLQGLRSRGHRVIIDDFGAGYSSLGYLTRLPVDAVKLDRMLIAEIDISDAQLAIAAGAIEMAKAAGLSVVAEGVERQSQLDLLRELDCDLIQGFLTGPPAPAPAPLPVWDQEEPATSVLVVDSAESGWTRATT